jgi:hemerythrin superfamily protein
MRFIICRKGSGSTAQKLHREVRRCSYVRTRKDFEVTTILKKDHRVVSGLIMTLQMTPKINGMVRKTLFDQIRKSLLVHAEAEEEILYPAMRNLMFMGGESKVSEAYREHQQIKDRLTDLATMDPVTEAFDRKLADLKSTVDDHVEEEEGEMFPMLMQRMSTDQQQELGTRIHNKKMQLKTRKAA